MENVSVHLWVYIQVYIWVDFCSLYFYAHVTLPIYKNTQAGQRGSVVGAYSAAVC